MKIKFGSVGIGKTETALSRMSGREVIGLSIRQAFPPLRSEKEVIEWLESLQPPEWFRGAVLDVFEERKK